MTVGCRLLEVCWSYQGIHFCSTLSTVRSTVHILFVCMFVWIVFRTIHAFSSPHFWPEKDSNFTLQYTVSPYRPGGILYGVTSNPRSVLQFLKFRKNE